MAKTLTATDRKALIRLASTLPKGSDERRTILGLLKTSGKIKLENERGDTIWLTETKFSIDGHTVWEDEKARYNDDYKTVVYDDLANAGKEYPGEIYPVGNRRDRDVIQWGQGDDGWRQQ